ncbi:hypothetical protein [Nonomuraea recticatena]|uniref:hypothetical protein n=1 Tax=Nonomuraea recticatena TaxID=46178 RepID=UPI00360FC225
MIDVGLGNPEDLTGRNLRGKLVLLEAAMAKDVYGQPTCGVAIERIGAIRDAGAAAIAHFPSAGTGCAIPLGIAQIPFTGPAKPVGIPNVSLPTRKRSSCASRSPTASGSPSE